LHRLFVVCPFSVKNSAADFLRPAFVTDTFIISEKNISIPAVPTLAQDVDFQITERLQLL